MAGARIRLPNPNLNMADVRREKAYAARKSRAGYLGRMTYLYSQIEQLMLDYGNVNNVKPIKDEIDDTYRKFVDKNKDLLENLDDDSEYRKTIEDYISKGYAVKLRPEESMKTNPNKPGKIRVVFDAAAKFSNTSLNDNLLQGPSLINDLDGVLLRFREEQSAFTADIEGLFYRRGHRRSSFSLVVWQSRRSARREQNDADHRHEYDAEVIHTVERNFYVDDVLKSVPTQEQAIKLATALIKLLKEGSFRLSKFSSNSREILSSVPKENRADHTLNMDLDSPLEEPWVSTGTLSQICSNSRPSSLTSQTPKEGCYPLCLKSPHLHATTAIELHVFSDASRRGLAAVAYLRMLNALNYVHCSFVMGKAKNAPLREWTMATRLSASILKERDLPIDSTTYWTDSSTVLQYIQNVQHTTRPNARSKPSLGNEAQ
ncbi:hypothetical protein AC249_AIPGENE24490 [Exaiptasia diaphana]|nr:hypothetical protein AC249_AIPGENE24490 [Exaiptasia diaphana]